MDLKPGDTLTMKAGSLNDICVALTATGAITMVAETLRAHGPVMGVSPEEVFAAVDKFGNEVIAAIDKAKESMLIVPAAESV